ncbi:GNAT family N-acetyltransferase [Myroides odoratimimus]|uniref:GNAT family N-acetyltransferase n=1 Tax=Myroides odoratimimus TaxID=76832 RepID=UPI0009142ECA|nr:GNAT family N-acetyltransferase [Myroides odoratimimus]SHL50683.1 Acetyltransferase (GNAT) domain-containing protein [Myroides odoratimimus subsp. xuanwuensis]
MRYKITELEQIDFNTIPWEFLVHYNGRADDLPPLLDQAISSDIRDSRYALFSLANNIEHKGGVITTTPIVLIRLFQLFKETPYNQDMLLRVILKVAKAIGFQWELFRDSNEFDNIPSIQELYSTHSSFLWPEFETREQDAMIWAATDMQKVFDYAWYYTKEVLCAYQPVLEQLVARDDIEQGLIYDILTVVKMVKDQQRNLIPLDKTWTSEHLKYVIVEDTYLEDFLTNLTPEITKFLSFDANGNQPLLKEYIRRSRIEIANGTALVLVLLDKDTNEFIGSCGLSDINKESVEIGLWIKTSKQSKGYGTEVTKKLIEITKSEINTSSILYAVEKGNEASVNIPNKFGFIHAYDFIIEPSPLKNRMREMQQFILML